jgi:Tol biopolymer transport system component
MGMSRDGAFAYVTGAGGLVSVVLVDRAGTPRPLTTEPALYNNPRLSPDGRRIALTIADGVGGKSDIWVFDIGQRTRTRVTFDETASRPIWTADGRRIIYSRLNQAADLYWIAADGSAPAESLMVAPDEQWTGTVTPDGRTLVYRGGGGGSAKRYLAALPLAGARVSQVFLQTPFDNHSPTLSPDGRWIAYVSDESGRSEVYVRPFPGPGGRWQVSLEGATEPRWSPSGGEIFYRAGNKMIAAAVQTRPAFTVGARRELFPDTYGSDLVWTDYDVTADGRRFVMLQPVAANSSGMIVVLNWFTNLGRGGANAAGARGR